MSDHRGKSASVREPDAEPITSIVVRRARAVTLAEGPRPRRGDSLRNLAIVDPADVWIVDDRIHAVARSGNLPANCPVAVDHHEIDAGGRILMPGFVDCHTHACWSGDRLDEWEMKLRGTAYLEILKAGGGIMSTVRAVRAAPGVHLEATLLDRLKHMSRHGTTTAEVKSGYGLTAENEVKMLAAAHAAAARWQGSLTSTALLGHAIDPAQPDFIRETIEVTLPAVSKIFPGITMDAYCEQGAWSLADCLALFDAAASHGHPVRVHADQFSSTGMVSEAVARGYRSVDHLEATTPADLRTLATSNTFGVMLPACGFHLDGRYADGRGFVEAGGAIAIATNCNPGSAPTHSMPFVIALAVRHLGLSPAEAISAGTINPAALLGFTDRGAIAPGHRADVIVLHHADERSLAYEVGANPVDIVICGGRIMEI